MTTLAELLNFAVTTLQTCPAIQATRIIETTQFSEHQFSIKIRAQLFHGDILQVRFYQNGGHIDYSYQVLVDDRPIKRWDNKEHFPNLISHPHHIHDKDGIVIDSPLTGDPFTDLPIVLNALTGEF